MSPALRANPHGKIIAAWSILTFLGISGFVLAKRDVERKRLEQMKVRERMRNSNTGDYEMARKF
jgi:hypothetical protein